MTYDVRLFWNRSVTIRLMAPIAAMLGLVLLLGMVGAISRSRVVAAQDTVEAEQTVHIALIEIRSLSRSLQRDVLNLIVEPDGDERKTVQHKIVKRSRDMAAALRALAGTSGFGVGINHATFLNEQRRVLDLLRQAGEQAKSGDREQAFSVFRTRIRPAERHASALADRLIGEQGRIVATQAALAHRVERQETIVRLIAAVCLFLMAASVSLLIIRRTVARPLRDIETAMVHLARGEASGSTPHVAKADEIGRMARSIEIFRAATIERDALRDEQAVQMQNTIAIERRRRAMDEAEAERSHRLSGAAETLETASAGPLGGLSDAARQLHAAANDMANWSASTREKLAEVEAATSRVTEGATEIAAATDQFMTDLELSRRETHAAAQDGKAATAQVDALIAQMRRVQDDVDRIGTVIDMVGGIARQTDLLALNASIEAARAGEAGRGFAVVAGEVKTLAAETALAAADIARRIAEMRSATRDAGTSLTQVGASIARIAERSSKLADDIGVQAGQGRIIGRNVVGTAEDLDLIVRRVADTSAASGKVDAMSRDLRSDAEAIAERTDALDAGLGAFFQGLHALAGEREADVHRSFTERPA